MRAGKSVTVSSAEARRLKVRVKDRNAPQKHVWRAKIVLLTADGVGTNEIMRQTGKSKTCVWRAVRCGTFLQQRPNLCLERCPRPDQIADHLNQ